ncbi:uncharacterized protein [Pyrus communis]|uniref:uncharacterized protein n=1 Tax=Pyrus communis TaxID=23211 RepID=UPI0035BF26C0
MPSSSRMMWEINQQEEELFNQSEGMFNLQVAQNEREEDEERRRRDDKAHSYRVIQAVAQISRPSRSANLDRSRMERHLFNKIMIAVCNHDSYFVQKKDAFGVMCLLLEQQITAALRMLAYRASADQVDEIARMGKSTILKSLMRFCRVIESMYTT